MFWGLIMEPQRRYSQVVKKSFHISMAALDISTSSEDPAQVMCGFEGRNYLLCTLKKPNMVQCPLDLNFDVGTEVSFAANGKCHVHLTGYLTEDLNMSDEDDEALEEEEEEEVEVDEEEVEDAVITKLKKRNKTKINGPPTKKAKGDKGIVSSSQLDKDSDDSESDDSDFNLSTALKQDSELSEEETDDNVEEDEENDENEGEDGDEDDEVSSLSDEEEEAEEEEEEEETVKPQKKSKLNGIAKKEEGSAKKQKNKEIKTPNKQEKDVKSPLKTPKNEQKQKTPSGKEQSGKKKEKRTLHGGVVIEDIREGNGEVAKSGKFVHVYYEGRLKDSNKMFDSSTKGPGFGFRLGKGEVIKGWDVGVQGMKVGGKRRISCPPAMAYGTKGSPPVIPPNSTLVFDVELKRMN